MSKHTQQKLRDAFEARMTDNGKWPRAVEQGRNGCYLLAQTENAWAEWQACAEALATTGPDMPLSMNQFGRLVELTREHLSDNTFVYKATSKTGDTCHFGVDSAAKAWAKGGAVEAIKVREFKLHTSVPTDDHLPDAGKKVETAEPGGERYSVQHEVTQGGHRLFTVTDSKTQCSEDVFPDDNPVLYGLLTELQARAALPTKPAVNQQLTTEPIDERAAFEKWLGIKPCGAAHDFGWSAWQARAALAARKPLSDMDRAVLRMPMDMALGNDIGRLQYYQRVQGLLDRLDGIGLEVKT